MEYYCSKVSTRIHFNELSTFLFIYVNSIKQQFKLIDNKKVLIKINVILFQDKAVAFKIFELGLKVFLKIIIFWI